MQTVRRLTRFDALALTAALWFLAKFLRYAFPPLFATFQGEYGVSNAAVGGAFSGLMLVYAATQFPSGALADRLGAVSVVTTGALVAAVGALFAGLAVRAPFPALVAAMLLVGLGTGAHKTVAVRLLSRVYPARTGRALGVLDTVGAFGGVAAPAAVVWALDGPGWSVVFFGGAAAGVVLAAAFAQRVPRRVPDDGATDGDGTPLRSYLSLFGRPRFSTFVAATVLFSFAYNGAVAFLPLYLTDAAMLSSETANAIYGSLFLVSLVQVVTGDLSDRVGRLPMLFATLALAGAGLAALLAFTGGSALALGTAVVALGLGSHGYRPVRGSYLVSVVPESTAGGALGVVRSLLMGAGAISPATVGVVSDAAGYEVAFTLLLAAVAGAVALVALLAVVPAADRGGSSAKG